MKAIAIVTVVALFVGCGPSGEERVRMEITNSCASVEGFRRVVGLDVTFLHQTDQSGVADATVEYINKVGGVETRVLNFDFVTLNHRCIVTRRIVRTAPPSITYGQDRTNNVNTIK